MSQLKQQQTNFKMGIKSNKFSEIFKKYELSFLNSIQI